MTKTNKTRKYEVELVNGDNLKPVRGSDADTAAAIIGRRLGADSARRVNGSSSRYQTVTCTDNGILLGKEFWLTRIEE